MCANGRGRCKLGHQMFRDIMPASNTLCKCKFFWQQRLSLSEYQHTAKNSTEIVQEILTRSKITFKDNYTFQETKVLEGLIDPLGMDEWVIYVFFYHDNNVALYILSICVQYLRSLVFWFDGLKKL